MTQSLSPKQYARLLFWPLAVLALVLLTLPTLAVQALIARGSVSFLTGWFLSIPTLSAGWLVYLVLLQHLKRWAARQALRYRVNRLVQAGCFPSIADHLRQQANRAEWRTLAGLCLLFGVHVVFVRPAAHGQARETERPEPARNVASPWQWDESPDRLADNAQAATAKARSLALELHLNEHGYLRALRYLRQGYPVSEVRALFAGTTRK